MHLPIGFFVKGRTRWSLTIVFLVLAASVLTACKRERSVEAALDEGAPLVSPDNQEFMTKAAQDHLAEIFMARLALLKSVNSDVREYANMIEKDHSAALTELVDLMKANRVPRPETLSTETQQRLIPMEELNGEEFDREFLNTMVVVHERIVDMYEERQATAENPDLQSYIETLLPELEMHLAKAQQLQSKLFNTGKPQPR